jgi:hypothetical protein
MEPLDFSTHINISRVQSKMQERHIRMKSIPEVQHNPRTVWLPSHNLIGYPETFSFIGFDTEMQPLFVALTYVESQFFALDVRRATESELARYWCSGQLPQPI